MCKPAPVFRMEFRKLLEHPLVKKIAKRHNKRPAQVLLRHTVQRGIGVIPKSTNPERIKSNIDIFDFELDVEEMAALKRLDVGPSAKVGNWESWTW